MFKNKPPIEPTALDKAIDECIENLKGFDPHTDEYAKTVKQLAELENVRQQSKKKAKSMFTPDAMLTAGASLLGILLILNYERANVVATKALGFVSKPKV